MPDLNPSTLPKKGVPFTLALTFILFAGALVATVLIAYMKPYSGLTSIDMASVQQMRYHAMIEKQQP